MGGSAWLFATKTGSCKAGSGIFRALTEGWTARKPKYNLEDFGGLFGQTTHRGPMTPAMSSTGLPNTDT